MDIKNYFVEQMVKFIQSTVSYFESEKNISSYLLNIYKLKCSQILEINAAYIVRSSSVPLFEGSFR